MKLWAQALARSADSWAVLARAAMDSRLERLTLSTLTWCWRYQMSLNWSIFLYSELFSRLSFWMTPAATLSAMAICMEVSMGSPAEVRKAMLCIALAPAWAEE